MFAVVAIGIAVGPDIHTGVGVPVESDDEDQSYSNKDLDSLISDIMVPSLAG